MRMVRVLWTDSELSGGDWRFASDFETWAKLPVTDAESIGYLWHEAETYLVLVQTLTIAAPGARDEVCNAVKIPRVAVRSIVELSAPE